MIASLSPIRKISGLSSLLAAAGGLMGATVAVQVQAQTSTSPQADQTYTLQRTFNAGDVDKYRVKLSYKMSGPQTLGEDQDRRISYLLKETTKSVSADGLVTLLDEYLNAEAQANGKPVDATNLPQVTLTRDKTGHMEVSADGGNEVTNPQMSSLAKQLLQAQLGALPTKPVKIGDVWAPDMSALEAETGTKITVSVKLIAVETVGGVKALKLKAVTDTSGGAVADTKMHGESTIEVDAKSGKPVKISSKSSGTAGGNKVSAELSLDLAGPGDEKTAPKEGAPK